MRLLEGTLAFADISGFTRLTEVLAARGKAGAEELTGFLDAIFAGLLAIAYANGGELITWGGDAALVWFAGEAHAKRAIDAAWRMQHAMGRIGRLKTAAGLTTLRMSVSVHSGSFRFFSVGARHRELLVTGPAATCTAHMEAAAEAGEIVVSAETARLLGRRTVASQADRLTVGCIGVATSPSEAQLNRHRPGGRRVRSASRAFQTHRSSDVRPAAVSGRRCCTAAQPR